MALEHFDPKEHFHIDKKFVGQKFLPVGVELTSPGIDLVIKYYNEKYGIEIQRVNNHTEIAERISSVRKKKGDQRVGFLLKHGEHSIPVVYVKEGGVESIIYGDSLGVAADDSGINTLKKLKIPIFQIPDLRQVDFFSCHVDALVFLRELLAKHPKSKKYLIPNLTELIDKLILKNKEEINYNSSEVIFIKAPPTTVKLAQYERFLHDHKPHFNMHVHYKIKKNRKLSLKQFLSIYGKEIEDLKSVNSYVRKKGLKFADTIEIQFYVEQLLKLGMNQETKKKFIQDAKKYFANHPNVLKENRSGLYGLAQGYAANLQIQNNPPRPKT